MTNDDIIMLKDAGHGLHFEQPAKVRQILHNFMLQDFNNDTDDEEMIHSGNSCSSSSSSEEASSSDEQTDRDEEESLKEDDAPLLRLPINTNMCP